MPNSEYRGKGANVGKKELQSQFKALFQGSYKFIAYFNRVTSTLTVYMGIGIHIGIEFYFLWQTAMGCLTERDEKSKRARRQR